MTKEQLPFPTSLQWPLWLELGSGSTKPPASSAKGTGEPLPEGHPAPGTLLLLQSCSMVAHCSDFFQVCASSSFLVLTASSNKLMLSWKSQVGNEHWGPFSARQDPESELLPPSQHLQGAPVYPSAPQHSDTSQHPKKLLFSAPSRYSLPCRPVPTPRGAIPPCWNTPAPIPVPILISSCPRSSRLPHTCAASGKHGPAGSRQEAPAVPGQPPGPRCPAKGSRAAQPGPCWLALSSGGSDLLIVPTKFLILR